MQGIPITKNGNSPLGTIIANLPKPEVTSISDSEAHKYIRVHRLTSQKINELLLLWLLRNKLQQDSKRNDNAQRKDRHHQTVQIISAWRQYGAVDIPYAYKDGKRTFNPVRLNGISNAVSLAPAGLTISPQNDELKNLARLIKPAKGHNPLIEPLKKEGDHGDITINNQRISQGGILIKQITTNEHEGITYIMRNPYDPEKILKKLEILERNLTTSEKPQHLARYRLVKSLLELLVVRITIHDYYFTEASTNDNTKQANVEIPPEFKNRANKKINEISSGIGASRIVFGVLWAAQAETAKQAAQKLQKFVTQIKRHFPAPEYNEEEHKPGLTKLADQQRRILLYRIYPLLEQ